MKFRTISQRKIIFDFADKYENKEEQFIDFVNDSSLCLANNYADTWTIIQKIETLY